MCIFSTCCIITLVICFIFYSLKINFVCFRGLLTAISGTIYENKDDWLICATKFKSIIYLCAFDTQQDIDRRANMTEREKLMTAWGYKFEQYMSSGKCKIIFLNLIKICI